MAMGRPKVELVLTQAEHAQLQSIARSRSLLGGTGGTGASMVLACADGASNSAMAAALRHDQCDRGQVAPALRRAAHRGLCTTSFVPASRADRR